MFQYMFESNRKSLLRKFDFVCCSTDVVASYNLLCSGVEFVNVLHSLEPPLRDASLNGRPKSVEGWTRNPNTEGVG